MHGLALNLKTVGQLVARTERSKALPMLLGRLLTSSAGRIVADDGAMILRVEARVQGSGTVHK
jgi:hypothetical protein